MFLQITLGIFAILLLLVFGLDGIKIKKIVHRGQHRVSRRRR